MRYSTYIAAALTLCAVNLASATSWAQASTSPERDARLARALNDPAWTVDEQGRVFRVAFPPHDRLFIDYGASFGGSSPPGERVGQRLHAAWKSTVGLDYDDEDIWWRFRHTFADVEYAWGAGTTRLSATLVRADYLRHDESSFVVIPAERDIKLPAPFDITVDYEVGGVELLGSAERSLFDDGSLAQIDVAQVALPLDFIRDPDYRHRLAVGPAAAYRIRPEDGSWGGPLRHQLAPLTGAELLYAWESSDGLYQLDLRGRCLRSVVFSSDARTQWQTDCSATARGEWVVGSINDAPVSIPVEANWTSDPARGQAEWRAFAGVRLSLEEAL